MSQYEVVVIGAGPGGYVAAIRAAQYGKKVAVIEKEYVGGVCLNVGCIPSKALIYASELYRKMSHAETFGFMMKGLAVDPAKLQGWKTSVVGKLTGGIRALLKAHKIDLIIGAAAFTSPTALAVKTKNETQAISFQQAIIATGSIPTPIPGFEPEGNVVGTSTDALSYETIPNTLGVIGGGYIGLELASTYAALGSRVTVIEAMNQILPGFDPDVVKVVEKELRRRGVEIHLSTQAKGWKKSGTEAELTIETPSGSQTVKVDKMLVAVGRKPNTQNLGLERIGIKQDEKGFIKVDAQLKTNVAGIYAIGDVAGQPMLAHKASKEGVIAAAVIAGKNETYDVRAMPAVIFTTPEIATVGLDEAGAKARGHTIKVGKFPFAASGKAIAINETDGFVKIISDAETDLVLGVIIVGAEASNLIGEAALAIEMGATTVDLARTVHPHPTLTESLMEAAEALHGHAIHIYQRK